MITTMSTFLYASYDDALELYISKGYQKSLDIIAKELDIDKDMIPDSPNYNLRFLAAHNHWKLGNLQSAITHFKKCIEIKRDNVDPIIDLSMLLVENRLFRDARYYAKKALDLEEVPIVYYILAKSALGLKKYSTAKEYYEKAISIKPEMGISYNGLGIALMRLKRYSEANTAFSAALAIIPNSPEVLNNIGICLEKAGNLDDALRYVKKASVLNPNNPIIKKNLRQLRKNAIKDTGD